MHRRGHGQSRVAQAHGYGTWSIGHKLAYEQALDVVCCGGVISRVGEGEKQQAAVRMWRYQATSRSRAA